MTDTVDDARADAAPTPIVEGSWIDVPPAQLQPASAALRSSPASGAKRSPRARTSFPVGRRFRQAAAQSRGSPARSPGNERAVEDEDEADVADEVVPARLQPAPAPAKRRKRPPPDDTLDTMSTTIIGAVRLALWPLSILLRTLVHLVRIGFVPALQLAVYAGLIIAGLGLPAWLLSATFRTTVSPFATLTHDVYGAIKASSPRDAYCATVGWGCTRPIEEEVAVLAHSVAEQAAQAVDIFASVSSLAQRKAFGIEFHKSLSAAIAIQAGTTLPERELFARRLSDFAYSSRDVGDKVDGINSRAIAAFSWTLYAFERVEKTISLMQTTRAYTTDDVATQLTQFFARLNLELDALIIELHDASKMADNAAKTGHLITADLTRESTRLSDERARAPALAKIFTESGRWKAHEHSRNLAVTQRSIADVSVMSQNLEAARRHLLNYRTNVGTFSATILGWHLSDNGLQAEHEVEALRAVMARFSQAVDSAKRGDAAPMHPSVDGIDGPRLAELN